MISGSPQVRARLLAWYDVNRRDLPWRSATPDPYRVWLSEVMLQQTRVDTVRAYYLRWLDRFPDLASLAAADQDEVLKAWEGLGYYSRARNFHAAVREVAATYGGSVPDEPGLFRELPGVGRYTAGAVMSIAFGLPEPIVDGNVRRVFARLLDLPEPSDAELWETAAVMVSGERPGDLNQALMELGATVCTPRTPACEQCPVEAFCQARTNGTERQRPLPKVKAAIPTEEHAVAVVMDGGRVLIVKRPDGGRLAGLWEFPGVQIAAGESVQAGAVRASRDLAGIETEPIRGLAPVSHAFTHVKVVYHPILMEPGPEVNGAVDRGLWVNADQIREYALPRAQQRILAQLGRALASPRRQRHFTTEDTEEH